MAASTTPGIRWQGDCPRWHRLVLADVVGTRPRAAGDSGCRAVRRIARKSPAPGGAPAPRAAAWSCGRPRALGHSRAGAVGSPHTRPSRCTRHAAPGRGRTTARAAGASRAPVPPPSSGSWSARRRPRRSADCAAGRARCCAGAAAERPRRDAARRAPGGGRPAPARRGPARAALAEPVRRKVWKRRRAALELLVGVEDDRVVLAIEEADGQGQLERAAAGLVEHPAAQPGAQHVQLRLAHGALGAQEEAVVEGGGVVDAPRSRMSVWVSTPESPAGGASRCCCAPGARPPARGRCRRARGRPRRRGSGSRRGRPPRPPTAPGRRR